MFSLNPIWTMPRPAKRLVSVAIDIAFIFISFWAAFYSRMGSIEAYWLDSEYWYVFVAVTIVTLLTFVNTGLYRAILRYLSLQVVVTIAFGAAISGLSIVLFSYYFQIFLPRSVPVIYATFLVSLCGGTRLLVRFLVSDFLVTGRTPVLIYGAGKAGRQLYNVLSQSDEYRVVAFVDDDRKMHKTTIQGVTVFRRKYLARLIDKHEVAKVLLAMPSASRSERKSVIELLSAYPVEVMTIPNLSDIVNGELHIDQLKEVAIEDLLGRDAVAPNQDLLEKNITNKSVMVTGAGGSIGSELCRQIIKLKPTILVLFEASEFSLYRIERELRQLDIAVSIVPIMGNVQNQSRLMHTMSAFMIDTVYHAAAYKHVPLVEHNVAEGVQNNVLGTYRTACAAIEANVSSFVLISTDKAVRPTNVMGTTKRLAELGLQALAKGYMKDHQTLFSMVRFGNVLGSSGSVIPLFKAQIAKGGPVTVTHKDIIRYFMTIPEAAQLVIQAGAMAKGGDVFVLDMGEPVRISDLAKNLIHLSGLEVKDEHNPDGDIELLYTGLRPGEKLFEELLIGDSVSKTSHDRIMTAQEVSMEQAEYNQLLDDLQQAAQDYDQQALRELMLQAPTGFVPTDGIGDLVWAQANVNESQTN
ncbi:nucleoside-diphosphate sugar epimerase/dehydratase [Vibrio mediterranei]|uniref:Nucleoside-diphosphate sugar epimerase n=1 Tax=Vibrio mediterranei TaxID=689 RepID=A0ABX5DE31_9VIBR|nr:nucleoside-diphosphate sugar epimerase/dehydratase [Vibrio mediterranei]PCD87689.1 nucleoside-diphosphate sugar epimerase [Vibrio mediterranei]PRQ67313.1 nucleoside-diphosphate sugar epimerase [Vibrio mediterranei]